ncbi:hypothetical protein ONZ45_g3368 [Pleurotus djamor]|nr:hypothetical protein ONZ45_g3368 [Pleurotus djamor]
MDPLTITTAVITFVTIGNSILEAARRVRKNSTRINELAEDVVADLSTLKDFCITHQQSLRRSSELRTSLHHLERCSVTRAIKSKSPRFEPWDHHYLEYQMSQVVISISTLRDAEVVVNGCIRPNFHSYSRLNLPGYSGPDNKIIMLQALGDLWKVVNEFHQLGHLTSQLLGEFIDLLSDLWEFLEPHANLLEFCQTMTTRVTSLSDDDNVWVVLTSFLQFSQQDAVSRLQDLISVDRRLLSIGLQRQGNWPMSFHYKRLVGHMSTLAFHCRVHEREEEAVAALREMIQLIYSPEIPVVYEHYAPLQLEDNSTVDQSILSVTRTTPSWAFCVDARVAQVYASSLANAFHILSSFSRHDDARMVALMARQLIYGMQSTSTSLPSDFDTLRNRLGWIEEALPASFSVERNVCSAYIEEEMDSRDTEASCDDVVATFETGQEVVEWGIAI